MNPEKEFREYLVQLYERTQEISKQSYNPGTILILEDFIKTFEIIIEKFNDLFPEPKEPPKDDRHVLAQTFGGKLRPALYDNKLKKWFFLDNKYNEIGKLEEKVIADHLDIAWREMEKKDES